MLNNDITKRVDARPEPALKVVPAAQAEAAAQGTIAQESYQGKARNLESRLLHQLTLAGVVKGAAMGAAGDVPFEGLMASQAYRRGEITPSRYAAKVATGALGFGVWTGVAGLVGMALAPVGMGAFGTALLGMGAGMIGQNVFDRVIGHDLTERLSKSLDDKKIKPMADAFTKYVANPLNDYFWSPVTKFLGHHKVLAIGAGALAALKFPGAAKFLAREGAVLAGGTAIGLAADKVVLDPLLGKKASEAEHAAAPDAADAQMAGFVDGYRSELDQLRQQGLSEADARVQLHQALQRLLVKQGFKPSEVAQMLNEVEKAALETESSSK